MNLISCFADPCSPFEQPLNSLENGNKEVDAEKPCYAMVPYVPPKPVRTWPNLYSLFTAASVVSNVACLLLQSPFSIAVNITIRCIKTGFLIQNNQNKEKMATDIVVVLALLMMKNGAIAAISSDLFFECLNFKRCEVSKKNLVDFCGLKFLKKEKEPFDILKYVKNTFHDPAIPENACINLGLPLDQINDQALIDKRYNNSSRQLFNKRVNRLRQRGYISYRGVERIRWYRDASYDTLTKRNQARLFLKEQCNIPEDKLDEVLKRVNLSYEQEPFK